MRVVSSDVPEETTVLEPGRKLFLEVVIAEVFKECSKFVLLERVFVEEVVELGEGLLVRLLQIGILPIQKQFFLDLSEFFVQIQIVHSMEFLDGF